jgi:hypothetical protein
MVSGGGRTLVHLFDYSMAMSGCSCVAPKGRYRMGMHSPKQINFLEVRNRRTPSAGAIRLEVARLGFAHQIGMA